MNIPKTPNPLLPDADGSGSIDEDEAADLFAAQVVGGGAGARAADLEAARQTARQMMQQMDRDRDGGISFDEFCFRFGF